MTDKLQKRLRQGKKDIARHAGKIATHVASLEEALDYAEAIVRTVREPLIMLDKDLRVEMASRAFYQLFRVTKSQTEGQLIYNLGNKQWNIPKLRTLLESVLPKDIHFDDFKVEHNFPKIGHKTILLNARRFYKDGEHILLAFEDISERTRLMERQISSEQRFRALIEKSEDVIALVDANGKVLYTSPATKRVLGYPPKEFQKLTNPFELVPPEESKIVTTIFQELLQKNGNTARTTYRIRHKDGTYRAIESIMTNLLNDPNVKAVVINYRDVTERQEIEKRKEDFISIASHELKTPITSIKVYTQILMRKMELVSEHGNLPMLQRINAQLNKLSQLVNDLLNVSHIQTGKLPLKSERFNIKELILQAIDDKKELGMQHRVTITSTGSCFVYADRERISQVLINLLDNAVKYSPKSKNINMEITTHGKTCITSIKDFGIGIPKDEQSKIFERFYRSEPDSSKFHGQGLGLFIASQIIQRHGGEIWVKSALGKGSTFYFSIPTKETH